MSRHVSVIHQDINAERVKLHSCIARHYGKNEVLDILGMLGAGSTDFHADVMQHWNTSTSRMGGLLSEAAEARRAPTNSQGAGS